MLDGLRLLVSTSVEAAKTEVALRDQGTHAEHLGSGDRSPIRVAGPRAFPTPGGDLTESPPCPGFPSTLLMLCREIASAGRNSGRDVVTTRQQLGFGKEVQDRRAERGGHLRGALEQGNCLRKASGAREGQTQDGGRNRPECSEVPASTKRDGALGERASLLKCAAAQLDETGAAVCVHEPIGIVSGSGRSDGFVGAGERIGELAKLGQAPTQERSRSDEMS